MENLIKKLQEEVGLTEEQAMKTISIMKEFMDNEGVEIDWDKFFKGKYENFMSEAKQLFGKAQDYSGKIVGKVDDFAVQAKQTAREFVKMFKEEK